MRKKIIFSAIITTLLVGLVGCTYSKDSNTDKIEEESKIKVTTSIYPIKEMAKSIGGDKISVRSMVPDGAEPHDFEPKAKDMVELSKSNLFIYNGLEMEHWVDKVLDTAGEENIKSINTSKNASIIEVNNEIHEDKFEDGHNHTEEDGHNHGRIDPHIWLSPIEALKQGKEIEQGLIEVDPANKKYYEENYIKFSEQLNDLYEEYKEKFKEITNKNFVTSHGAFAYLCRDFGLTQNSVEDAFGEGEITPKHLKELSDYCKKNNVKVIFTPDTESEKVSDTLAKEINAKVAKISSLETKSQDKSYLEIMKNNLETIYQNMKN